jgi:hypothetical protein
LLASVAYETERETRHFGGRRLEIGAVAGFGLTSGFYEPADYGTIDERTHYLIGVAAEV